MANDEYTRENDTSLEQNLGSETIYTPENDLSLTTDLTSVPILETVTAQATASGGQTQLLTGVFKVTGAGAAADGSTLTVSGQTTINLSTGEASATGGTTNLQDTGVDIQTDASATGAGDTVKITTFPTIEASASGTGGQTQIDVTNTETLEVPSPAQATGTGETALTITPSIKLGLGAEATATGGSTKITTLPTIEAEAEATGSETRIDVPGNEGEITVLIDGERISTYTNIEVQKRLNEVDTFSFEAFIEDSSDRQLIQEGKEVKIIENYTDLLFKGVLNEVEYQSTFRAKCEGNGMVQKLLDRKTDRDEYGNSAGDEIVKAEVPTSVISRGAIEEAPSVSVRFDHDNLARAVAGVANATGYDWYIDQEDSDDFDTDYLNFVDQAGDGTVQKTFDIGDNAMLVKRNKDEGFVANDITLLGRGDGINQLQANVFAASTHYTDTTQAIDENESTSFTVDDTSQLGSTNDNLVVRVGTERMDVTITDSTTLSINSRGLDDYNGDATEQIKHYENVRVWLVENVTQGTGPFTPEDRNTAEDGSSIDTFGVKEQRETDKTIVDTATLEKTADLELKNRFEDIFRVQVDPTEPRVTQDLSLGDTVKAEDLTAMDVSDEFRVVGMDVKRNSSEEGTTLHLANRPRRLTERLSEIESNTDTLNAHMQGATNFNGEHFEDNVDNTHPLTNSVFVPEDVVAINKFELTFKRESFRGYVQNQNHSHDVDVTHPEHSHTIDNIPDHDHDVTIDIPDHSHDIENFLESEGTAIRFSSSVPANTRLDGLTNANMEISGSPDNIETGGIVTGSAGSNHTHDWPADTSAGTGTVEIDFTQSDFSHQHSWPADNFLDTAIGCDLLTTSDGNPPHTTESGGGYFDTTTSDTQNSPDTTETSQNALGTTSTETSTNSGAPSYGIFEPGSEPDIDVEVRVDGNLVKTVNNVSVGEEITTPIKLKNDLSEPLTGTYHDIELKPIETIGGNNGRSRLAADITEKVFIESKL